MTTVFIHGLGQTAAAWQGVTERLGLSGAACPELGTLASGANGYNALYRAFEDFCDGLDEPLRLCGLSLGGVLALQYAIGHPRDVDSLVLIGAQYDMPKALLTMQNAVFRLMPRRAFEGTGFGKEGMIALCASMRSLSFSLQEVRCPALALCGEQDRANRKAAEKLAEGIAGAKLEIIPGAGHELNVDAPDALAAALKRFWG